MSTADLEERGIITAAAVDGSNGLLNGLAGWPQGAVLHLHPFPAASAAHGIVPQEWLDTAARWLAAQARPGARAAAGVDGFQFDAAVADTSALLAEAASASANCLVVHGEAGGQVNAIHLHHLVEPALLLAMGGQSADLSTAVPALQEVGRQIAPQVAYACISVEPTLAALWQGHPTVDGMRDEMALLVRQVVDEVALDGFCWQVLTQRHLDRLGGAQHDDRPLPAVEVAVGNTDDWLPGSPTAGKVRERARILLDGVLVDDIEATRLVRARRHGT